MKFKIIHSIKHNFIIHNKIYNLKHIIMILIILNKINIHNKLILKNLLINILNKLILKIQFKI